ncbi:MAG: polysaccharide biosynthesis protein [Proteobacteria bacterium]|nr:polysaccharide biosynthesis protein [Pseudomonadota bacterium]MBU4068200.1 polysaccharide biosynthesis protein [Pseudomonadota bacterium]
MKKILISKNLFVLILADAVLLAISYFLAYVVRFEAHIGPRELLVIKQTIVPMLLCKLAVFYFFNLYRGMWRYTGIVDLLNVIKAVLVSSLIIITVVLMLSRFQGFSRSIFVIDAVFSLILIAGIRLVIRLLLSTTTFSLNNNGIINEHKKMIIIGAGDAGEKVVREIYDNPRMKYRVVGFVDDDKNKLGKQIHGIKVLGRIDELKEVVKKEGIDEILIAAPSAVGKDMRRIVEICDATKIPYKTLPGMGELIDGKVSIKAIRDVSYKDLLGRPPVRLENNKISEFLKNKCVLITGAGGSIGSELCRQICTHRPSLLVLFDAGESNLYSIQMELKHVVTYIKYRAVLGRIQDKALVDEIFRKYKPDVVFHAAAYKHVPLVERNPWEAVYSNIVGTNTLVKAAIAHKVDRFVLVSTDKAVRPTNVMGASKRITEKIVQSYSSGSTKFMAVRFGNVIGSSGSVIPLYRHQIEKGGPVTVTHPEITRFFMTIEESAQLILQAFTMGEGGEIFILEMGTPVKIVDMARDLIRLSGKEPDIDIEIKFIGLRPGEKLYEELITEGEGIVKTEHEKILVLRDESLSGDTEYYNKLNRLDEQIKELTHLADMHDAKGIKSKLKEIVPEYTISDDEAVV